MSQKCTYCGCDLEQMILDGRTECIYCGHHITINTDDKEYEKQLEEAAELRNAGCFDSADQVYRRLKAEYGSRYQIIWGRLLCKYGVVYVEKDSSERVMQCWKSQNTIFMDEGNLEMVYRLAEGSEISQFRKDAEMITDIQKRIQEKRDIDYDIFLCYKESDYINDKKIQTRDSMFVNQLYQLLKDDYKVFYAGISLKNKYGADYDAEIFNAIKKSRVMIVFGSKIEYFTSTWVQSEWSRYLNTEDGTEKEKNLIPMMLNVKVENLPKELQKGQCFFVGTDAKQRFDGLKLRLMNLFPEKRKLILAPNNDMARQAMLMIENGDLEAGLSLLQREANGSNPAEACYLLGAYYFVKDTEASSSAAFEWFKKAAEKGYTKACFQTGFMYEQGIGVQKNLEKADYYMKRHKDLQKMEKQNTAC